MWGHEQVIHVDGLPLRVIRHGEGSPLLLINGLGAPAEMWTPFATLLDDYQLIAFDLPGSGASPPAPHPTRMKGLARIAAQLLDALDIPHADVLGYSFGGLLAQELARRNPQRVDRLVLCATTSGLAGVPPRPLPALLMLSPIRYFSRPAAEWMVPLIAGGQTRRDPHALEENLRHRLANPPNMVGYLQQIWAATGWSSKAWLGRLSQPTLILHGDDDPLVPLVNARWMAATMRNARLTVFPGAGHLFLLDQPDRVVPELIAFLEPRAD